MRGSHRLEAVDSEKRHTTSICYDHEVEAALIIDPEESMDKVMTLSLGDGSRSYRTASLRTIRLSTYSLHHGQVLSPPYV
jgi:hypothetical protein